MVEVPLPSPRRCAARRMATFPAAPLLLALEALAATSKGLPAPARFASALLPRAQVWGGGSGGGGAGGAFCPRWPTLRRRCYLGHRCVRWGEGLCWGLLPDPARFASPLLPRAQAGGSMCVPQGASVGNVLKIQASSWMVGSSASLIQELLSRIVPPKTCLPPFPHPPHSGPTAGVVR